MSGVSLPVTRPTGRGLLVGSSAARGEPAQWLRRLGCVCVEIEDPYAGMAEIAARPLAYSSLVLSLGTLFREELEMIAAVKRRYGHIEVWLARADGRQAAMDEAMGLGADGFIAEDGLHRLSAPQERATETCGTNEAAAVRGDEPLPLGEPVLSAEELRALLDEPPVMGPASA